MEKIVDIQDKMKTLHTMDQLTKKGFQKRIKKICSSELSAFKKIIAQNDFETPVQTPAIGILDYAL